MGKLQDRGKKNQGKYEARIINETKRELKVVISYQSLKINSDDRKTSGRSAAVSVGGQVADVAGGIVSISAPVEFSKSKNSERSHGESIEADTSDIPSFEGFVNAKNERVFNLAQGTQECYITVYTKKKKGEGYKMRERNLLMRCSQKYTFTKKDLNNEIKQ